MDSMLKQLSVLIGLGGLAMTSCQTLEFEDVVPEMAGSPLGDVKLGKEGVDFFVVPGKPVTPEQIRGEVPVPPENIVVFKTREQTVPYKMARAAGAPARGAQHLFAKVYTKVTSFARGLFSFGKNKKAREPEPEMAPQFDREALERKQQQMARGAMPVIYPAGMLPEESFANTRAQGASSGRSAARELHPTLNNRNGG